jgi:hypothetical protein
MPMFLYNRRCTTSTTMTCASVRMRDGAEDLHKQQCESTRVGPRPKFKDWDSYVPLPLGLTTWRTHSPDSNKICLLRYSLATCTYPESQMWHLLSLYMSQKEWVCCHSYFTYVTYLTQGCHTPARSTDVPELMQYLQIFFTKKWWLSKMLSNSFTHLLSVSSFLFIVQERRNI